MDPKSTYSQIIKPATYNRLMAQHLYISQADKVIARIVRSYSHIIWHTTQQCEVLEIGCGPARILRRLRKALSLGRLTGIDHDAAFIDYAQSRLVNVAVAVGCADVLTYVHPRPLDIIVSQGFHHHVPKGTQTADYLAAVRRQLKPGGIYIVGDEFLPDYDTPGTRLARAVVWYSHIINAALEAGHKKLAVEEAKTLLDDLVADVPWLKNKNDAQIQQILTYVARIDYSARSDFRDETAQVHTFVEQLLDELQKLATPDSSPDPALALSRGDFKICHKVFAKEVQDARFQIIGVTTVGPIETIGGMAVYVLKRVGD